MEPIIPIRNLDRDVFEIPQNGQNPIMHSAARVQIMSDVLKLNSIATVRYAVVFGDILVTPEPNTNCNVLVGFKEKDINKINFMSLNIVTKNLNQRFLLGTRHRMNYILTIDDYDSHKFEQIYAPFDEKWLKYTINENIKKKFKVNEEVKFGFLKKKKKDDTKDLTWGKGAFQHAKNIESGLVPLNTTQAIDIAEHFRIIIPNRKTLYKMLGNTRIMLYRPKRDKFYLVVGDALKNKIKKMVEKKRIINAYAP